MGMHPMGIPIGMQPQGNSSWEPIMGSNLLPKPFLGGEMRCFKNMCQEDLHGGGVHVRSHVRRYRRTSQCRRFFFSLHEKAMSLLGSGFVGKRFPKETCH